MSETLLGVIIGSSVTLISGVVTGIIAYFRESKTFKLKRKAEIEDRKSEEKKEKKQSTSELYHKSIKYLSLILASRKDENDCTEKKKHDLIGEAYNWLSLLSIHIVDNFGDGEAKFHSYLSGFLISSENYVESLLESVKRLSLIDEFFASNNVIENDKIGIRKIKIMIAEDFIRTQAIEGKELPHLYPFDISMEELSKNQRKILWDTFCTSLKPKYFPDMMLLHLPKLDENRKEINHLGFTWQAKINPFLVEKIEILNEWESDYNKKLKKIKEKLTVLNGEAE